VRRCCLVVVGLFLGSVVPLLTPGATVAAGPAPGELDTSYGVGGIARLSVDGQRTIWRGLTVAGRSTVVAGTAVRPNQVLDGVLARIGPRGRLDRGFGDGGTTRIHVAARMIELLDVVRVPDGRFVAVGSVTPRGTQTSRILVVGLRSDGRLDRRFGDQGLVKPRFGGRSSAAMAVVALPEGKVAIGGWVASKDGSSNAMALVRLIRTGSLDKAFNGTGRLVVNTPGQTIDSVLALTKASGGRLVAAGNSYGATDGIALLRVTAAGEPDPTFGSAGFSLLDLGDNDTVSAVTSLADDSVVLAGKTIAPTGQWRGLLAAVRATGELDPGFGDAGLVEIPVAHDNTTLLGVAKGVDGQLVAVGDAVPRGVKGQWQSIVIRTDALGSLDPSFGDGGIVLASLGARFSSLQDVHVLASGRIIAAGHAANLHQSTGAVARFVG